MGRFADTVWKGPEEQPKGWRPDINVLRLDPSLTIDQNDIEGFLETFEPVLADARA